MASRARGTTSTPPSSHSTKQCKRDVSLHIPLVRTVSFPPAQPELREEPVLVQVPARRLINVQLDRSDELVRVLCQVGAVIGAREASERVRSSRCRHREDQQESGEPDPGHMSLTVDAILLSGPSRR
jgi:hypothetical protein